MNVLRLDRQEPARPSHPPTLPSGPPPVPEKSLRGDRKWLTAVALALLAALAASPFAWSRFMVSDIPAGFARSNGRIEAERVDIATKLAGRIKEVLVKEGDAVAIGQVLARMDTIELEAQIHEAQAAVRQQVMIIHSPPLEMQGELAGRM